MGGEAQKTNAIRGLDFITRYFRGRVIDIGCGDDLVVPQAEGFDRAQGDAGRILDVRPAGAYDCVHSSHCLEHMADVPGALAQWWALVRPGGVLVLVVPDEDLYEQGAWPSAFNEEHVATFRLDRPAAGSPVSFDLRSLLTALPDADVLDLSIQDQGYDYALRCRIGPWRRALFRISCWRSAAMQRFLGRGFLIRILDAVVYRLERLLGCPVDQTSGPALAQIQAVVRKRDHRA